MDQLMQTIGELFTLSNLVFCVFIWIMVWIQRKIIEIIWNKFKKTDIKTSKYWRGLFLPLGPIGTGSILAAIFNTYPFPEMFSTFSSKVIFGAVLGLLSAHVYKIIKELFDNKLRELLKEKIKSFSAAEEEEINSDDSL